MRGVIGQIRAESPWDWDRYTWAWLIWVVWFVVWETLALLDDDNPETLSEHIWWIRNEGPSIVVFLLVGLLAWLVYHFTVEGR